MSVTTISPNIDLHLQHKDLKLISGQAVTIRPWISTSYSNVSSSFSCPPPSTSIFIDRCIIMGIQVVITYAGTTGASALLQQGCDALRAFPIASILNSTQMTINNVTVTQQTSEIVPYLARYWKKKEFTSFPAYQDTYQSYADGTTAMNNALGQYMNSIYKYNPRGGYPMVIVNGATSSTITATIFEPIWLPVLHKQFGDGLGFTNVKTMDIVLNYSSNLSRIVSHAANNTTLSSVNVVVGQGTIYMMYTSPPYGYVPQTLSYRSEQIQRFVTPCPTAPLTSNTTATFASTNLQLNSIPQWMLVFSREATQNLTYASTDTFQRINNMSISFNNV